MGTTWDPASPPYFEAVCDGTGVKTSGSPRIQLGHRIDLGPGREPAGNWVEWEWDGERLEVRNDRFRGYPLYYMQGPASVAVSPSIDALLGLGGDRGLDTDAIAVFLTIGHFVGEDTPFRAIRALPPAAKLTWRAGGLEDLVEPAPAPAHRDVSGRCRTWSGRAVARCRSTLHSR